MKKQNDTNLGFMNLYNKNKKDKKMKKLLLILPIYALVGNAAFGASGAYVRFYTPLFSYTESKNDITMLGGLYNSETTTKTTSFLNGGGLAAGYDFNDIFAIEGSYSRTKVDYGSVGSFGSETTRNTFGLSGIVRIASYQSFDFNVIGLAGYANTYTPSYKMDGFTFGLGAEAEYNLSENAALALGARYTNANQKWKEGANKVENKTDSVELYTSLKHRF
jgi:hypothetical protein